MVRSKPYQGFLVLLLLAVEPRFAFADEKAVVRHAPPEPSEVRKNQSNARREGWYGWQTLALDTASIGIGLLGGVALATEEDQLVPFGATCVLGSAVPYLFGPPILHAVHGHAEKTWVSFGLRLGMPLAGFAVGALPECNSGDFCKVGYGVIGGAVGIVGAMVIDATWLAWERPVASQRAAFRAGTIELIPKLMLSPERAEFMLAGRM